MGNSSSSSQGGFGTYDRRDINGNGFKDDRPYEFHELVGAQKTKTNSFESSNPNPLQVTTDLYWNENYLSEREVRVVHHLHKDDGSRTEMKLSEW